MWTPDAVLWLRDVVINCPEFSMKVSSQNAYETWNHIEMWKEHWTNNFKSLTTHQIGFCYRSVEVCNQLKDINSIQSSFPRKFIIKLTCLSLLESSLFPSAVNLATFTVVFHILLSKSKYAVRVILPLIRKKHSCHASTHKNMQLLS